MVFLRKCLNLTANIHFLDQAHVLQEAVLPYFDLSEFSTKWVLHNFVL